MGLREYAIVGATAVAAFAGGAYVNQGYLTAAGRSMTEPLAVVYSVVKNVPEAIENTRINPVNGLVGTLGGAGIGLGLSWGAAWGLGKLRDFVRK
ncbi:hypothetical protein HYV81_05475 [Candidatus Woesearchaeota archaeon]|nr:hypothetical protein [Candidatus Woesearchaeota archaeon]